ncbi:DNA helicase MCM9 isoform X1 [Dendroctonus ponderosae]|uniref:DNA helicase MCM9 isoform X1 n=1 Tax=Dendroctonus ponderosae TaxID=77166 RepID=UPI0020359090|nr:DNA helicase MCM9 isoform X1 [Dendroctonus ponderosae]
MCENYLISNHTDEIGVILESPEEDKCFSLSINFIELYESDTDLGNAVLTEPENSLKIWDKAAINVQLKLLQSSPNYSLKNNVHCRIFNLPSWPHVSRAIFPGNRDANKFLQLTGIVLRISPRKLLEYQRQYFCAKCKFPIIVEVLYDKKNIIKKPTYCSNPDGCSSKNIVNFEEIDARNYKDYQEIKIQEDLSQMGVGTMPNHLLVTLEDDLVNVCKPGENVTITGIVKRRWSEFCIGAKIEIDIVLRANHVQVNNSSTFAEVSEDVQQFFNAFWKTHQSNPLIGRNIILKSTAPEIYGLHLVKLAVAIVLAGGSQSSAPDSTTGVEIRSNPHLLLIGDPGTGKSQILKFVSKIIPRTVLTTGVGSTSAGLTVAALMENGEWQLEAGALVMADGGLCCIDEFNSMKEHDRHCIHEAMEQQTISVAKAGIVCKLNTRCTILAACNPKGRMDPLQSLDLNSGISSPLLSRFDLILLLRDIANEDSDRKLAEYIMDKSFLSSRESKLWTVDKLQSYYALIRNLTPKLSNDAETILSTYYQLLRQFSYRNKSRTTVRLLESLIRLSQGHAKLMYHLEVYVVDALFAVVLTDAASDSQASFLDLNLDNNSFSDNPDQLYWEVLETVLGKLNLYHIYEKEARKRPPKEETSSGSESRASTEDLSSGHAQQPRMLLSPVRLSQGFCSQSSEDPSTSGIRKPLEDGEKRPGLFAQEYTWLKSPTSELPVQSDFDRRVSRKTPEDSKDSGNCSRLFGECFNSETSINKSSLQEERCSIRKAEVGLDGSKNQLDSRDSGLSKSVQSGTKDTDKTPSLYEIVKSQRDMDFDLNIDFLYSNNGDESEPKKSQKRCSKRVSETGSKCKKSNNKEAERPLFELLPSDNDDFSNIVEHIDWDLGEAPIKPCSDTETFNSGEISNSQLSQQLVPSRLIENVATTSKCSLSSTSQICTKNTVKNNEVFNLDFDLDDLDCPFESANPFAGTKLRKLTDSKEDQCSFTNSDRGFSKAAEENPQSAGKPIVRKKFIFKKTRNMDT